MNLSNTSQYAIRILAYMADKQDSTLINATMLADALIIPYKFLTKIMTELVKANLVVSIRGRDGGYQLKKVASEIKVDDILYIFNDNISDKQCLLGIGVCNKLCKCSMHDQWMKPKLQLQKMFQESSLADIAGEGSKI